jgi:hypothetical protein
MSGEVASWEALTGLASEGKLLVEDGIAFECATLCAEFIGVLKAVGQDGLFDGASAVTASHPAPLESLNALDVQLTQLSNDLYDRIGNSDTSYLAALENMLQLLKEAGKKYQETEDGSSDDFDLDSVTPASGTDVTIASHDGDIHSKEFLLGRLENAELSRSAGLWPEDHEDQSFETLYEIGDHIRTSGIAGLYENLGTKWYRWGDTVRNSAGDFVNTLVGRTAGAWEREGSQGAITASRDFGTQLESLVEAMWRVADAYRYAALWLASTEEAMPKDERNYMGTYREERGGEAPFPYLDENTLDEAYTHYEATATFYDAGTGYETAEIVRVVEDPTPYYQEKLASTYLAGIGETNQYFPILPEYVGGTPPPDPEPTPEPDPNPAPGPGPDPNPIPGNPAGNPGGAYGPSASGLPSAEEELRRLAAGTADQEERAARELAEQQSQQMVPQLMQAAQQGLGMVQQALQDAAQRSMANSMSPGGLPTSELPPGVDLPETAGLPGLGAGGPGGSPGAGLSNPGGSRPPIDTARLFPRAGLPGTSTPQAGLGGTQASGMPAGSGAPMGGAPMGGGGGGAPGGGGRGQGDDKHERAKYLDRADNIDEGLGETLDMTRPVVGEAVNRPPAERPQPVVRRQRAESPQAPAPAPVPARPSNSEEPVVLPGREGA